MIELFLLALAGYAFVGGLFVVVFVVRVIERVDPTARGASVAFRLLILPGAAALWPLLAWRWRRAASPNGES